MSTWLDVLKDQNREVLVREQLVLDKIEAGQRVSRREWEELQYNRALLAQLMKSTAYYAVFARKGLQKPAPAPEVSQANPVAKRNFAPAVAVAVQVLAPFVVKYGMGKWRELLQLPLDERVQALDHLLQDVSWVSGVGGLAYRFTPFKAGKQAVLREVAKAMESASVQRAAEAGAIQAVTAATRSPVSTSSAVAASAAKVEKIRFNPGSPEWDRIWKPVTPESDQLLGALWAQHQGRVLIQGIQVRQVWVSKRLPRRYAFELANGEFAVREPQDFGLTSAVLRTGLSQEHVMLTYRNPWDESKRSTASPCKRCGGEGKLEQFAHVYGGACMACGGSGLTGRDWRSEEPVDRFTSNDFRFLVFHVGKSLYLLIRESDFEKYGTPALDPGNHFLCTPFFRSNKGEIGRYLGPYDPKTRMGGVDWKQGVSAPLSWLEYKHPGAVKLLRNYWDFQTGASGVSISKEELKEAKGLDALFRRYSKHLQGLLELRYQSKTPEQVGRGE